MKLKNFVYTAAVLVFLTCFYSFLKGTEILEGRFKDDPLSLYFLAKGIFCSISLFLSYNLLEVIKKDKI